MTGDDEQSVRILANLQRAMPEHGRVLITEIVLELGKPIGHPIAFVDLEMMVTLGGKERTAQEFSDLLRRSHLRLERFTSSETASSRLSRDRGASLASQGSQSSSQLVAGANRMPAELRH